MRLSATITLASLLTALPHALAADIVKPGRVVGAAPNATPEVARRPTSTSAVELAWLIGAWSCDLSSRHETTGQRPVTSRRRQVITLGPDPKLANWWLSETFEGDDTNGAVVLASHYTLDRASGEHELVFRSADGSFAYSNYSRRRDNDLEFNGRIQFGAQRGTFYKLIRRLNDRRYSTRLTIDTDERRSETWGECTKVAARD